MLVSLTDLDELQNLFNRADFDLVGSVDHELFILGLVDGEILLVHLLSLDDKQIINDLVVYLNVAQFDLEFDFLVHLSRGYLHLIDSCEEVLHREDQDT